MAGMLDLIVPGSDGGGLLDFLKRNIAGNEPSDSFADRWNANSQGTPSAAIDSAGYMPTPSPGFSDSFADRFNAPRLPSAAFTSANYAPALSQGFPDAQGAPSVPAPQNAIDAATAPLNAPQASPIAVGNYNMPRVGNATLFAPPQDNAALPPNAQPTQGQGLPVPDAPAAPSAPGGFMTAYQNFRNGGGLIGSIAAGMTGQRTDPYGQAQQQQAQVANVTARALIAKGVDPQTAIAAVQPGNAEMLKQLMTQAFNQGQFTQETDKDGNVWNVNKLTGEKKIEYQPKDDSFQNVEVKDGMGNVVGTRTLNKRTGEYGPVQGTGVTSGAILGDANKTGADYVASLPADKRDTVKGMIDGTIQPPTSFAAAKPYWQQMIAAAKHADPAWDENNWAARHKMSVDLASSGNSSMGGILSNGESSFKHLAEYTNSAVGQGNASHNFPLGGVIAHGQNYIGNSLGGSDTQAKVKATNDNLGHYGQESTKFYAGTGGGVEERMNALKEMNAEKTSGEESAAYAEKEKGLMLDRLNQKLLQIKEVFGEEKGNRVIAQHMPEIQKSIKTINDNIDKLRGITPGAPGSASFGTPIDVQAAETPGVPSLRVGESATVNGVTIKKTGDGK